MNDQSFPRRVRGRRPLPTLFHASSAYISLDYGSSRTEVRYLQIARVRDGDACYIDRVFSAFPSLRLFLLHTPNPSSPANAFRTYGPVGPLDGPVVPEFTAYLREDTAAAAGGAQ
ncbi:hypothetical protein JCM10449v2_000221 [Rhodotorula kratochvilovae]